MQLKLGVRLAGGTSWKLEQETRQIGGTTMGQMFGTSKTVMLLDIMSASLCMVSARGSPTTRDDA